MRLARVAFSFCLVGFLGACDGGDGGTFPATAGDSTEVSQSLDLASTKISNAIPDTSGITAASTFVKSLDPRVSINTEWTDTDYGFGGDFGTTPQDFILKQGDSTAQSSLMFRFNQALENLCLFTTALPTTNGVVDLSPASTVTLDATLLATMSSVCGVDTSQILPEGSVVGYIVEDVSAVSGSQFERRVGFDLEGGSDFLDFFYFTITDTVTRFAYKEISSINDSIVIFDYDSATGIGMLEFSEKSPGAGGFELHYRVLLDENSNQGVYIANVDSNGDTADGVVSAAVATQEGGGSQLVVSLSFDDGVNSIVDGNACVSTTDFSIAADNTLTCTNPAITGTAVSNFTADVSGIGSTYDLNGFDETSFIQFTNTADIFTAVLAQ